MESPWVRSCRVGDELGIRSALGVEFACDHSVDGGYLDVSLRGVCAKERVAFERLDSSLGSQHTQAARGDVGEVHETYGFTQAQHLHEGSRDGFVDGYGLEGDLEEAGGR
eukprot:1391602-Amorphochlora_amoeboformis.AAC.2